MKSSFSDSLKLVLGIDGGGTKTAVWLAAIDEREVRDPIGKGVSGPGNPRAVGFDTACRNISAAISSAFENAGIAPQRVFAACFGLAGADRASEQNQLSAWCDDKKIADHIVLTNDADPLLAAASDENWGVALIAGTGSIAYGRDQRGQSARSGGWGYLLGDEGSGYAIALAGLKAAARSADGRAPPTSMLELFQQRWQTATAQGLIEAIYRPEVSRQQIAEGADVVFEAARGGDVEAVRLVAEAAAELADLVHSLTRKLQLPAGQYPLAIAGGMLLHQERLRTELQARLTSLQCNPRTVSLVEDPVRGAVQIARRVAKQVLKQTENT